MRDIQIGQAGAGGKELASQTKNAGTTKTRNPVVALPMMPLNERWSVKLPTRFASEAGRRPSSISGFYVIEPMGPGRE